MAPVAQTRPLLAAVSTRSSEEHLGGSGASSHAQGQQEKLAGGHRSDAGGPHPPGSVPDVFLRPPHDMQRQGIDARGQLFLCQAQGYLLARVQVLDHDAGQDFLQGRAGETMASVIFLDPSRVAVEGANWRGNLVREGPLLPPELLFFALRGSQLLRGDTAQLCRKPAWEGACLKPSAGHPKGTRRGTSSVSSLPEFDRGLWGPITSPDTTWPSADFPFSCNDRVCVCV